MDISQTNIANFGTELEYNIKLASAKGEEAFKIFDVPHTGTFIFRVGGFKLELVLDDGDVANFFRGDSYVVASVTATVPPSCDIFYWIGDETSIDEAGTAAYKAFELDNIFNMKATQYRETCGSESLKFRALFPAMRILSGGYDSGFKHVTVGKFTPRLFRVYSDKIMEGVSVAQSNQYLYLTMSGGLLKIYQYCNNIGQRYIVARAARYLDEAYKNAVDVVVVDWDEFTSVLGGNIAVEHDAKNVARASTVSMCVKYSAADCKFGIVDAVPADCGSDVYLELKGGTCHVYGRLPLAALCANEYLKGNSSAGTCVFVKK
jgi:Gelsolin repeat